MCLRWIGGCGHRRGTKAHPKGAALWIIREVERQTSLFRDAEYADPAHPSDPGRRDDQVRRLLRNIRSAEPDIFTRHATQHRTIFG